MRLLFSAEEEIRSIQNGQRKQHNAGADPHSAFPEGIDKQKRSEYGGKEPATIFFLALCSRSMSEKKGSGTYIFT